jgi:hypothetical protein
MATRMQQRRGTAEQWTIANPVLAAGEIGWESDTNKFKMGDGVNEWEELDYFINESQIEGSVDDFIPLGQKGASNGVATLDGNGKLTSSQVPSIDELAQDAVNAALTAGTGITKTYDDNANILTVAVDTTTIATKAYVDSEIEAIPTPDYTGLATESYVNTAVSNLVASAPAALDTLNELAEALGDDANFATTITNSLAAKAPLASPTFTGTVSGITKTMVGLDNVDNTSDNNKPVSTATQTALDLKVNNSDPAIDYYVVNSGSGAYLVNGVSNGTIYFEKGKKYRIHVNASGHPFWIQTVSGAYSSSNIYSTGITNNGTQDGHIIVELASNAPQLYYACQYHSSMVGSIVTGTTFATYKALADLSNVNNTSDASKPVSTATQTALDLKASLASPTFTGTVTLPSTTSIGSVSATELGYLDGVSSAIQDQLNGNYVMSLMGAI